MNHVVVVEDEPTVRDVVRFHLERAGLRVSAFETTHQSLDALGSADALVLDWMLPTESGLSFLRRLRGDPEHRRLPVLMLTARAAEAERVEGLESGADDYLTKPFSAAELVARVRALLRRAAPETLQVLTNGPLTIDLAGAEARLSGERLLLTRREFDLLAFLTHNLSRVYGRTELLDRVWGADFLGGERTVDQHITQLRAHLREDPTSPRFLETVRGKGYRMRNWNHEQG
ncbi:response regulator transcription factor [Deinococcus peraridilitoris]|uniref:Response regulator with CheY-like receiver domain and winged-helix DNA-binding domain protein n=1 Tax=Deinococcus peraridilitoris (strain DSM 19664 / LMG 22246 / CIP 109416 / KR-200) TaxID=937777 RepID=L0A013_DEIPD|nr:response regulator transcription factor [Deinococcus peraridilitoris]AFZ66360.1 response regulator with CheY-like receiver domain and winged-helix DNA-binding domain protein [Deinococcus peraridilitoris DSM 19664]